LKGLELGCTGIITATCNVTSALARKVYDDFFEKKEQTSNENLCNIRREFEKYNLISGLHTFYSKNDLIYKNVLPPLSILNSNEEKELIDNLEKLNFSTNPIMAA
jgi:4-hydroxy-tetrahydrodipicolinate synthase